MPNIDGLLKQPVTHEWATPQDFFDLLDEQYHFVFDVAASDEHHRCDAYWTIRDNGLAQPWPTDGWVWCNPPYGDQMPKWVAKAASESRERAVRSVLLLPARVDTAWFHNHVMVGASLVFFVRGRLSFGDAGSAPFPSMVVVYDWLRGVKFNDDLFGPMFGAIERRKTVDTGQQALVMDDGG